MKLIIFIISILSRDIVKVASKTCSEPHTYMSWLHILRYADVNVTIYRCYSSSHSDITKQCINAFNTGLFIDKWGTKYYRNATNSPVKFETYTAKANIMQNEIHLRSGTVCRYDRGFCYDLKESIDFAVVWAVTHKQPDINAENLIGIFYGAANVWQLREKSLVYVVLQESGKDYSFALRLGNNSKLNGTTFWYTDGYGMIVIEQDFKKNVKPFWDKKYFPLKPKQIVSEQVLRNCDLQDFPFDFEKNIYQNYILDENNLVAILKIFQTHLIETKTKLAVINEENSTNNKTVTELQKDLKGIKTSLLAKDQEVAEIRGTIKNILTDISKRDADYSKLQKEIEQILVQQQGDDAEHGKIKEKLVILQNQLSKLNDDSNEKKINKEFAKLENNFTLLETTLLEQNKEIFKALSSKDKLINDIKTSLSDLNGEVHNEYIELQNGQVNITNRLDNMGLDLNGRNNDIAQFQIYTNLILMQNQKDINANINGLDKLELKYNDILTKLNLHDAEISKCQNYTTILLFDKDKLLNVTDENIKSTQSSVQQLEEKIRDLLNKDIELEKNVYKIDGITTKLKENITRELQEFIVMVNESNKEIKTIKEKCEEYCKVVDQMNSKEVQRNLTYMQNILAKQDDDILKLQGILKDIYEQLNANNKDFTEAINDYKRYVNTSRQTKDEEISQIHNVLIEKDAEIKKLYEYLKNIDENTGKELKARDDEIKRIQNVLIIKDEEYKKLEEKIKKIEQDIKIVDMN